MGLELYAFPPSVPCRMVRLLTEYLELDVDVKNVDILKGEQMDSDYIKVSYNNYSVARLSVLLPIFLVRISTTVRTLVC